METPLKGIMVTELANVLAGPSVGLFLAEMGATVIKVENVKSCGDVTRHWKLPVENPDTDISSYFSCVNWGKQSLAVDMSTGDGLEIVNRLVRKSDILLSSYKPGDAEKLKVDYNSLKALNEKLIYAHVTGYGPDNPRAGYDAIIQAESGFTYMNGEPGGNPTKMPVALMDVLAAHQMKEAILLALLSRERGGGGQFIEASLLRSGVASLANQATNWLVGRSIPRRMGSDHPNIVPYGTIFSTADGKEIVLAVGTDKQFGELCRLLGRPEMAYDERFVKNYNRVVNSEELKRVLQELIGGYERKEILELLESRRVPAGGVFNMKEVFETPEAASMLIEAPFNSGSIKGVSSVAFSSDRIEVARNLLPPPHYGEHSKQILTNLLGYSGDRIDELLKNNVIYAS
ncbi:MAG: CoA transferase [Marinilabiliales bacterium]|nr:MAG: CoA transferase [Marinilabiliales bacterium]